MIGRIAVSPREGALGKGKVVHIDFRKGRKPSSGGFGGGPRLLFAVFLAVLTIELLAVAVLYPSIIGSYFFGPTVIAVAVACTLGLRRVIARVQVARVYQRTHGGKGPVQSDDDSTGRTLH
jgi:hypothetical protein